MKTNYDIACEVLEGLWGNGPERKIRIEDAGFSYSEVQSIVNCLVKDRNRNVENFDRFLEVEIDLDEYDGLNLKFKHGKGGQE